MSIETRLRGVRLKLGELAVSGTPADQFKGNLKEETRTPSLIRRPTLDRPNIPTPPATAFGSAVPSSIDRTRKVPTVPVLGYRAPAIPSAGSLSYRQSENLDNLGGRLKRKFFTSDTSGMAGIAERTTTRTFGYKQP